MTTSGRLNVPSPVETAGRTHTQEHQGPLGGGQDTNIPGNTDMFVSLADWMSRWLNEAQVMRV